MEGLVFPAARGPLLGRAARRYETGIFHWSYAGDTALHLAADGYVTGPAWDPVRQVGMLALLREAGADLDAQDRNGATALHRAVRTRCAAAAGCGLARDFGYRACRRKGRRGKGRGRKVTSLSTGY